MDVKENFEKWIKEFLLSIKGRGSIRRIPGSIRKYSNRRIGINFLREEYRNYYDGLVNTYYKNLGIDRNMYCSGECYICVKCYPGNG